MVARTVAPVTASATWRALARTLLGEPALTSPEVAHDAGIAFERARRLWRALKHPASPAWLKWAVAGLALYLLSPVDLLPDVIPVLGLVDDLVLIPLAIRALLNRLPANVRADALRADAIETYPRFVGRWVEALRPSATLPHGEKRLLAAERDRLIHGPDAVRRRSASLRAVTDRG